MSDTLRRRFWLAGTVILFALTPSSVFAQTVRTWGGGTTPASTLTSGTHNWNVTTHWSANDVPNTSGESGTISDTLTGDRTILIDTATFNQINWTSNTTTGGTFVDTLKLANDVTLTISPNIVGINLNNEGAVGQKVLDLNGNDLTMTLAQQLALGTGSMTVRNTGATPAVFTSRRFSNGVSATIESGVTLRAASNLTQSAGNLTMLDGSIFRPAATATMLIQAQPTTGFYDLYIESGQPTIEQHMRARNNVTIAPGANLGFRNAARTLSIGGNFDDGGSGDYFYHATAGTSGGIIFDGGASTIRTVSAPRVGVTTTFYQVGSTTTPGNVKLLSDIGTGIGFTVKSGSLIDLDDFTVTSGALTLEPSATLTYSFGSDSGLIDVNGNATVNTFNLKLVNGVGWSYFDELVLVRYDGTLTGTPAFGTVTIDGAFQHGPLINDTANKELRVQIFPEPTGAAILLVASGLMLRRRRRGAGLPDHRS